LTTLQELVPDIELHYTQTTDGLKLTQASAITLYNELKKIDAIQA